LVTNLISFYPRINLFPNLLAQFRILPEINPAGVRPVIVRIRNETGGTRISMDQIDRNRLFFRHRRLVPSTGFV
jgi:hypothetical protein